MEKDSLRYRDERDRCYGATGMAIGIVAVDGEDYIAQVTVDGPADRLLEFTGDFYFTGNPRLSAKNSWNQLVRSYNLSVIAMLSNVLCRTMVLDDMPVRFETKQLLHDLVAQEGSESCSLEDDEVERVFNKNYDYLLRIFNHEGVKSIAHDFAKVLMERRTMTRLEILENLKALSMI